MDNDINIVIDHSKLEARDLEAIIVRMVEQREPVYGAFSELVLGLSGLMTDVWDMKQVKIHESGCLYQAIHSTCIYVDHSKRGHLLAICEADPCRS